MFQNIVLIAAQVKEAFSEGGLKTIFLKRVYWRRIAIPVELDLSSLPVISTLGTPEFEFKELKREDILAESLTFIQTSRKHKALINLKKGWRCFCIICNSTIIADLWCVCFEPNDQRKKSHPDLKTMGITCGDKSAYAFDMFIYPNYRGKNLAVPLQRFLQTKLKEEGYNKVYGYYWEDSLPALWMHRMLKFKELPKRQIYRFFIFNYSQIFRENNLKH